MIYFFHHYELPVIIQQAQVQQILRLRTRQRHQQQNGNGAHGATNNAANQRNNPDMANQNNNDAIANQMNNNAAATNTNSNNNNNTSTNNNNIQNNNNNNNANLLANISFFLNLQMASVLINHAINAMGTLQNLLSNDIFGTAAFFNNNNDNNLNNNNNNISRVNITRLRINLNQLRRINLAGIQINPNENVDNIRILDGGNGSVSNGNSNGSTINVSSVSPSDINAVTATIMQQRQQEQATSINTENNDGSNVPMVETVEAPTPNVGNNHDVLVDSAISFQHQFSNNVSVACNNLETNLHCDDDDDVNKNAIRNNSNDEDNLKLKLQSIVTNESDIINDKNEIEQNVKLNKDDEATENPQFAHYSQLLCDAPNKNVEIENNAIGNQSPTPQQQPILTPSPTLSLHRFPLPSVTKRSDSSYNTILVDNSRENFENSICATAATPVKEETECDGIMQVDSDERVFMNQLNADVCRQNCEQNNKNQLPIDRDFIENDTGTQQSTVQVDDSDNDCESSRRNALDKQQVLQVQQKSFNLLQEQQEQQHQPSDDLSNVHMKSRQNFSIENYNLKQGDMEYNCFADSHNTTSNLTKEFKLPITAIEDATQTVDSDTLAKVNLNFGQNRLQSANATDNEVSNQIDDSQSTSEDGNI